MIEFNLENVLDDWLDVTFAPDGIEYTIETGDRRINGNMYRIQEFVALYECVTHQISSSEHPSTTLHDLRLINGFTELAFDDMLVQISRDELKSELSTFLKQIFDELNKNTDSEDRKNRAFRRISDFCLEDEFERVYREVMTG